LLSFRHYFVHNFLLFVGKCRLPVGKLQNRVGKSRERVGESDYRIGNRLSLIGKRKKHVGKFRYRVGKFSYRFGKSCYRFGKRRKHNGSRKTLSGSSFHHIGNRSSLVGKHRNSPANSDTPNFLNFQELKTRRGSKLPVNLSEAVVKKTILRCALTSSLPFVRYFITNFLRLFEGDVKGRFI
jgi:uncharacterized protein YjbJ (UPF0337 family)